MFVKKCLLKKLKAVKKKKKKKNIVNSLYILYKRE